MRQISELAKRAGIPLKQTKKDNYLVCCPFHDDKNPSCSLTDNVGKNGGGLFYCFSCGAKGDSIDFLKGVGIPESEAFRMRDGDSSNFKKTEVRFTSEAKEKEKPPPKIITKLPNNYDAIYYYGDNIVQMRWEATGEWKKRFATFTKIAENKWICKAPRANQTPIYCLRSTETKHIVIVEGEKCAHALYDFTDKKVNVATSLGGSARAEYFLNQYENLTRDRFVTLFPDYDFSGIKMMFQIAEKIKPVAKGVIVAAPFKAELRYDIADAIRDGITLMQLSSAIRTGRCNFNAKKTPTKSGAVFAGASTNWSNNL